MSKPSITRKVTGVDCLNYVNRGIGLVSCAPAGLGSVYDYRISGELCEDFYHTGELAGQFVRASDLQTYLQYRRFFEFVRFHHNNRVVGLILGENDDSSYKIALLGSEHIKWGYGSTLDTIDGTRVTYNIATSTIEENNGKYDLPSLITYQQMLPSGEYVHATIYEEDWETQTNRFVPLDEAFDFKLHLKCLENIHSIINVFMTTGKYQGTNIQQDNCDFTLTTNKNNTLVLGIPVSEMLSNIPENSNMFMSDSYNSFFESWEGNIYNMLENIYNGVGGMRMQSGIVPAFVYEGTPLNLYSRPYGAKADHTYEGYEGKTHAFQFTPFNLILTRSESQALEYLNSGAVPSDAFLYPLDWENLPRTDGTPSNEDENTDPTDYPTPNGDSGIDGTPTEDADPTITTNMLNNNNLYWLQAGQLELFITWFWQHAGEIIDLEDAWQKLTGLYNNLAEAIINIRYFPVDPQYIGGTEITNNIIIASIECPINNVKKLLKTKLHKRILGGINIPKKYGMFTDYSPYTSIMLYLPFHGWVELDIDLFIGNRLEVRCVYDHISGTIQYGIYVISKGKEFLVNSCVAKMAVDIPITLQSKSDRDSAIFQNVASGVGNFLGAGASIAQGNPIGLVMSTGGLASGGSQSAPLKTMGTMGESGAFFLPNKCAYYIKRPSYNIPSDYASRVGYPSNQGGKLSSFRGLTVVYNPQISFKGNENADGVTMKPLESEIQEIYQLLEKGVII